MCSILIWYVTIYLFVCIYFFRMNMWWFFLIVTISRLRITKETYFWVCSCFWSSLHEEGRFILNVTGIISWFRVKNWSESIRKGPQWIIISEVLTEHPNSDNKIHCPCLSGLLAYSKDYTQSWSYEEPVTWMNLEGMIPNCFSYDLICMFEISVKTKQRQTTKNQQTKPKQKSTLQYFIASKSSDVIKRSLCMHNYTIT